MDFSRVLTNWYSVNKRILPWRDTKNPYLIWLSEIILQQTQIKQGLPYYQKFIEAFPDVFSLANASEEEILKLWQGLGYYSRARNLHVTAKYIAYDLQGKFPNSYKQLLTLKGVGDYTASAIASFAFNEASAVVDGNVYRLLSRYFGIDTPVNSTKGIKDFKLLAQDLIDYNDPGTYNQAIMEFGSIQCKPKNPDCTYCPLNTSCFALQHNRIKELPVKIKKTKIVTKYFNYLVIIDENKQVLFEKRDSGIWKNLYQFPLIETIKPVESVEKMKYLIGEILHESITEYDVSLYNNKDIIHKLSHRTLYTRFWIVSTVSLHAKAIALNKISNYPMPILIHNFVEEFRGATHDKI